MDNVEMILMSNYYHIYPNGNQTRNENFISLPRKGAIHKLEEDFNFLLEVDSDLVTAYQETIVTLEEMTNEEYEALKGTLV
ncbi:hypothetical protein HMPREF1514_1796 [Streptococcus sp. AS20]|uniref:Uncharacterized protein n=1 Tax=Streptococcus anginosus SK1138 TaxID=1161422 RepID=A0AAD2T656_STRAP|nr:MULTISPECIES: hypothetical protein [Streptococcus]EJP24350.1 hypothetical protein HMPREF1126_0912 [Streptococcus anginosus SK1138]EUB25935.1 hypothetical protein HMPREF1514_1796 [Streptococcus sp. AS20]